MSDIRNTAIKNNSHLCWKCLKEYPIENIHHFQFGDLGYGSLFDSFGTEMQLCDKCYEESNPAIWDFREVDTDIIYGGRYPYEKEIYDFVKTLPLAGQELFHNSCSYGTGACFKMKPQDWIDNELGILSYDKCKTYGLYSLQEEKAYEDKFCSCQYPVNVKYEKHDAESECPFGALGEYGQKIDDSICVEECYLCKHYKKRISPILTINDKDFNDYSLYVKYMLKKETLDNMFKDKVIV